MKNSILALAVLGLVGLLAHFAGALKNRLGRILGALAGLLGRAGDPTMVLPSGGTISRITLGILCILASCFVFLLLRKLWATSPSPSPGMPHSPPPQGAEKTAWAEPPFKVKDVITDPTAPCLKTGMQVGSCDCDMHKGYVGDI